ncbi:hypothetical protein BZL29_7761 [Mycobacterium kansasii]|uniref:Uncharacterized protein n=1 Tax=Mycobacterium kansasii TaxID=1768 RepID=A0A1V3WES0_MYCKA|nr:hypothetical protein BZL29_7761 [Mycobacterium kansasii]
MPGVHSLLEQHVAAGTLSTDRPNTRMLLGHRQGRDLRTARRTAGRRRPLPPGGPPDGDDGVTGPAGPVLLTGVTGVAAPAAAGGIIAIGAPPMPGAAAAGVVTEPTVVAAAGAAAAATFCATWLPTLPAAPRPFATPLTAPDAIRADVSAIPDPKPANPGARPAPAPAPVPTPVPAPAALGNCPACAPAGFIPPGLPIPFPAPADPGDIIEPGDIDAGDDPPPDEIGFIICPITELGLLPPDPICGAVGVGCVGFVPF